MPTIDAGVKTQITEHYKENITKLLFEDGDKTTPVFATCQHKMEPDGFGRAYISRITTYEGAAVAANATIADTIAGDGNAGGRPTRNRWEVDSIVIDSTFFFSRAEVLVLSKKGKKEQFNTITSEMDMAVRRLRFVLAEQVVNKGWGLLARSVGSVGTTGFTVGKADVNKFRVGDRLQAAPTEDDDALSNAAAQCRVTSVNPSTGVIGTAENPQTQWANAQLYIFKAGMHQSADPNLALSSRQSLSGLRAWIDPSSTAAMWNVTRSGDPNLLGYSLDATGMDTRQSLIEAADVMFRFGRMCDTVFVSGTSWKLLNLDTDAAKMVEGTKVGPYQIGFKAYQLPTVFGMIDVMPDPFIPEGEAYIGPFQDKEKAPYLCYAGDELINLDDLDGKEFERQTSGGTRNFKGQFFFQGQLVVDGPGFYGKITGMATA